MTFFVVVIVLFIVVVIAIVFFFFSGLPVRPEPVPPGLGAHVPEASWIVATATRPPGGFFEFRGP